MLKLIVLIVIAILVLSFFGISLRHIAALPATQENFAFVWQLLMTGWSNIVQFFQQIMDFFVGVFNSGASLKF